MLKKLVIMLIGLALCLLNADILWEEGFESGALPEGWSQEYVNGTTDWIYENGGYSGNPATAHSGVYNAQFYNSGGEITKLISAETNLGTSNNGTLTFWHTQAVWAGDQDELKIYYKTSQAGQWNLLEHYTSDTPNWTEEIIDLPFPSTTYYIAFEGIGQYGYGVCIDDVTVEGLPTVYDNDLAASSISGPGNINQGTSEVYDIIVSNVGENAQSDYTVKLFKQGNIELSSLDVTLELPAGEQVTHSMVWNIPGDEPEGNSYLWGEVILDGDENLPNNTTGNLNVEIFPEGLVQITVGDGNDLDNRIPASFYYNNSISETIYYPSELNSGGIISAISYDNNFVSSLHGKPVSIWMGETTLTSFTDGWLSASELDLVFDGNVNLASGQNTILFTLQEPYLYEGGNLVVFFQRSWDNSSYDINDRFYVTLTSEYPDRTIYNRDNTEVYNPENPPEQFFVFDIFPNTTFYFSFGDLGDVEGYVYNEDSNPLQGVQVVREGSTSPTYSNQQGYFQFTNVPTGLQSFTATHFGYNPQTIEVEVLEDETVEIEFFLQPLGSVAVSGYVAGSDFPETGLEDATVSLFGFDDYSTITNAEGYFFFPEVYSNNNYQLEISHEEYQLYSEEISIPGTDTDLGTLIVNEITVPPSNVFAVQNAEQTEVEITWNMPGIGSSEFRYDDDTVQFQIGFNDTPANAVFGASHPHNAIIQEVSWLLTSDYATHTHVKIFIFGLNYLGLPDSDQLLYQSGLVPNIDDEWNNYLLPEGIHAENGFLVGVNTPNLYTSVALDDGLGNPWIFIPETQMAIQNYTSGNWIDIGDVDNVFQKNMMIRAYGMDFGEIEFAANSFSPEIDYLNSLNIEKTQIDLPANSIQRDFESFNVYRFPESEHYSPENWDLIAEALLDTSYTDTDWAPLPIDTYQFAITSVHTNSVESDPSFSNVIFKSSVSADDNEMALSTNLFDAHPNPFSFSTTISFDLSRKDAKNAKIDIYNIKGQKVRQISIDDSRYTIVWNGKDDSGKPVNSGIYFYKLEAGKYESTKRMILMK